MSSHTGNMKLTLHVWRQKSRTDAGRMARYTLDHVSPDMSFLEMLDVVNEGLVERGEEPIAFEHDCREGICGSCGMMINGVAHGPERETTACQLHMRSFRDGDEIVIEPWRARAFPVLKDLVVDRAAFDRAMQQVLLAHKIDLVCLAGFMRLLTPEFVGLWSERMLNIHPALLPAFKGLDTHQRALDARAVIHGATVHFVVPEMDAGPIILQGTVAVRENDTEATLAARVLTVEHKIYPAALRLVAEGRVAVVDGRCLVDGKPVPAASDLPLLA